MVAFGNHLGNGVHHLARHSVTEFMGRSVEQLRRFERLCELYLRRVRKSHATEDFSAVDMRLIQVMSMPNGTGSGASLAACLSLHKGYVCRVLKKLEAYGLVAAQDSATDGRAREWRLTEEGHEFAATIDSQCRDRADIRVDFLPEKDRRRLVEAMSTVEELLLTPELYRF
jgi:DNA-binding MarR family transcriptional regulator